MKKTLFFCMMVISTVMLFNSCEKATIDQGSSKIPYDPNAPVDTVYFNADIIPIFSSNCTSCHASHAPILEASVAYTNLMNGYVSAGLPSASSLYVKLTDVSSDHLGRSTQSQQDKIFQWISQGALNN